MLYGHIQSEKVLANFRDMVECMNVLLDLLKKASNQIACVYQNYTEEKLVRDLWNFILRGSILVLKNLKTIVNVVKIE